MAGALHLAKRFFGAIRPGPPTADDERWAQAQLLPGEIEVWGRMNNPDRRHAVGVARAVVAAEQAADPTRSVARPVIAAALLHDSGKVVCGFRTPARVLATLCWATLDDTTADRWLAAEGDGFRLRLAQYRRHPELGEELLRAAGSAPLTYQWAAQHHRPESAWTVPLKIGRVLKECDDD